jgi:hypothetical protein
LKRKKKPVVGAFFLLLRHQKVCEIEIRQKKNSDLKAGWSRHLVITENEERKQNNLPQINMKQDGRV